MPLFATHAASRPQTPSTAPQGLARGPRPNALAGVLAAEDILLDCDVTTRERAFACVATALGSHHGLAAQDIVAGLDTREALGSTALGQGVAIPHARLAGLKRAIAAFVRLRAAIPFDAPDGKPVSSLLVLLVPEGATDAHLELLAQAASLFCDKAFRDRLSHCATAPEILATLTAGGAS
jgi:PTS system nitrogen regulatory IIA component